MTTTRRTFIIHASASTAAATFSALSVNTAFAQNTAVLETDPQAVGLGYKILAEKVDKVKFPKFAANQNCKNCQLYQGKASDKAGGCPLFGAKQVAATAWCSAWVKKAA